MKINIQIYGLIFIMMLLISCNDDSGNNADIELSSSSKSIEESSSSEDEVIESSSSSNDQDVYSSSSLSKIEYSSSSSSTEIKWNTAVDYEVFTDNRDGQKYKTVKIGNQKWMAENLRFDTLYNIQSWVIPLEPYKAYGRLYTQTLALEVCPAGTHLPTIDEWKVLSSFVDNESKDGNVQRGLKSTSGWINTNGDDLYGFRALPAGQFFIEKFKEYGRCGTWWTSDKLLPAYMCDADKIGFNQIANELNGFSVRCIVN